MFVKVAVVAKREDVSQQPRPVDARATIIDDNRCPVWLPSHRAISTCLLLYHEPLTEMSAARLKVIRETTDGFRIAEEDLRLRGEGEVLGTRQSGLPGYRIARPEVHAQLIAQARDEALRIMQTDPKLKGERGEALRCLLYLYERDEALPLIGAG